MKNSIDSFLDLFYPIFSRFMDRQTYRYAALGGSNTLLGIILFSFSYNFIFHKQDVHFGSHLATTPHVAAFLFSFMFTFPIGFLSMRHIVFTDSNLRGRVQLFRYLLVVLLCFLLNYVFLKFFVEQLHIYPTPSQILTTCITIAVSYVSQKYFTFKVKEVED